MGTGVSPKRISTKQEWTNFFKNLWMYWPTFRESCFPKESSCEVSLPNMKSGKPFTWISHSITFIGFLRHRTAVENFSSKSKLFELTLYTPSFLYENLMFQKSNNTQTPTLSLERRWSSRTFRYGYLVTTSPQSSVLPSAAPSLGTLTSGITNSHGVTGGVYKTRERIHRSMLICDY